MISFSRNFCFLNSLYITSVGLFACNISSSFIFSSSLFSSCFSVFFLWTDNDMILPRRTALLVSQSNEADDFGESFISRKDVHSVLK